MKKLRRNKSSGLGRASGHGGAADEEGEERHSFEGPPRWIMLACLAGSFMLTECLFRYFVFGEQC